MNYDALQTSVDSSAPIEVYDILAGSTPYAYTTAQDEQTVGVTTYTSAPGLRRSKIADGPTKRDTDFQIELPTTDPVAQLFVGNIPGIRIRLTVTRFQRNDTPTPETVQVFDGYIQSAQFRQQGALCILTARSLLSSLGRQIPRRTYQSACNYVVYDSKTCKVDDTDPTFRASAVSVDSASANVLTCAAGSLASYSTAWFNTGYVESVGSNDFRMVIDHTGDVLTLHTPFSTNPTSLNVFAGCGHSPTDCDGKFGNFLRYGGFPFVPLRNPFTTGVF